MTSLLSLAREHHFISLQGHVDPGHNYHIPFHPSPQGKSKPLDAESTTSSDLSRFKHYIQPSFITQRKLSYSRLTTTVAQEQQSVLAIHSIIKIMILHSHQRNSEKSSAHVYHCSYSRRFWLEQSVKSSHICKKYTRYNIYTKRFIQKTIEHSIRDS